MSTFTTHTIESAPEASKAILQGSEKALGFVPNLYANLAESPATLQAYTQLSGAFDKTTLTATEQQVILITASVYNGCEFCVAAHSLLAGMKKVDADVIAALRERRAISDSKLEALAEFTRQVVDQRGWVSDEQTQAFLAAGYSHENALEVVLGVTLKTLSNYTNHVTGTQVNAELAATAWSKDS